MFKSRSREKLINAVLFFASNLQQPDKKKILSLLYLLDFEHFTQTGHSVTGLEYAAWAQGPVPIDFLAEWDEPDRDLAAAIGAPWDRSAYQVTARKPFDAQWYSKRELRLMSTLAERFRDAPVADLEEAARNEPWTMMWDDGLGRGQVIDYALAIPADNPRREELLAIAREYALTMLGIARRVRHRHPA